MHPLKKTAFVAILLAAALALVGGAPAARADDKPSAPKGQRIAWAGHSFLVFVPPILRDIATSAEVKEQSYPAFSGIGGSRVIQHWDVPEDKNKVKAALRDGKVDVLVLSPIWLPDDGIEKFVQLAVEHNAKARIHIQEFWMPFDRREKDIKKDRPKKVERGERTAKDLHDLHAAYFRSMGEHVRALRKKHGEAAVFVVPAGQAVIALRERIISGKAHGVKTQDDLFTDAIGHAPPPLQALVGDCHY